MLLEVLAGILKLILFLCMTLGDHHSSLTEMDMIGKVRHDQHVEHGNCCTMERV